MCKALHCGIQIQLLLGPEIKALPCIPGGTRQSPVSSPALLFCWPAVRQRAGSYQQRTQKLPELANFSETAQVDNCRANLMHLEVNWRQHEV